ncbi:hypothetical protein A2U01_0052592, partial [Trifolium medium]|nr:hypothetical protein [Trifolium medium]
MYRSQFYVCASSSTAAESASAAAPDSAAVALPNFDLCCVEM